MLLLWVWFVVFDVSEFFICYYIEYYYVVFIFNDLVFFWVLVIVVDVYGFVVMLLEVDCILEVC